MLIAERKRWVMYLMRCLKSQWGPYLLNRVINAIYYLCLSKWRNEIREGWGWGGASDDCSSVQTQLYFQTLFTVPLSLLRSLTIVLSFFPSVIFPQSPLQLFLSLLQYLSTSFFYELTSQPSHQSSHSNQSVTYHSGSQTPLDFFLTVSFI